MADRQQTPNLSRRLLAEALGTFFLLAGIVGSGIMAKALAGPNDALALLANAIATGMLLTVLILIFAPISGAHFNPAVSLVMALRRDIAPGLALLYVLIQVLAGSLGVLAAHAMFDQPLIQISATARSSPGLLIAEVVATFGLLATILGLARYGVSHIAAGVGLYITSAIWFTASTSFANPAVTVARTITDTFTGILPAHMPAFIAAQLLGACLAWIAFGHLLAEDDGA
ncbi:MAG: aquaporin [Alphaproteobacteria bacterium]